MIRFDDQQPASPKNLARRYVGPLAIALAAAFIAFMASSLIGPRRIGLSDFVEAITNYDALNDAHLIARDIRLPRALLGLMVGASLAAAGAVMQGVTRNPLAGPTIMGLSGGGSLAVLIALIAIPGLSYKGSMAVSFVGAALGYGCIWTVACLSPGGFAPARLALAGAVTSALLGSLTQGLIICYAMAGDMLYWTAGGIANVTWSQVTAMLPCFIVGLAAAFWLAPSITVLSLGKETAIGLGQRTALVRTCATLAVLLLTAGAVAVAGPVSFVGLMVPHACRLMVGADYRRLIPLSAVVGAGLTEVADVGARTFLGPGREMPLGVLTAAIGAPCFVWLVRSRGSRGFDGGMPASAVGRTHRRPQRVLPILACLLLAAFVVALHMGYTPTSPTALINAILGYGRPDEQLVLLSFRLPRIVFAVLVGGGIAVAGAVLQGVLRNDLAEPGILGISAGASLGVVLSFAVMGYAVLNSVFLLPVVAICGSLGAMLAVYLLSLGAQHSSPRLLLIGVAVSAALSAVTLLASLHISSQAHAYAVAFSAGSLSSADWSYVLVMAVWLGVLVPVIWGQAPTLNVLRLGDAAATGLGVAVARRSLLLLAMSVAACAACMALAGGVMFLGLIAPHIARRLVGADHAAVIPAAGLTGAILLIAADALGSQVVPGIEIPAGVMISALGAPYFLFLLTRR